LFNSVFFIDADTGYIASWYGLVFKTTNGGATWIVQNVDIGNTLHCVFFSTANIGYVGGEYGTIFKTINGGTTWTKQAGLLRNGPVETIYFIDNNTGYAFGDGLFKTTDAGSTWQILTDQIGGQSAYFIDADTAYAVGGDSGDHCSIDKTTDGGHTWFSQFCGTINVLYSVFFIDAHTGYAVGEGGIILKTTNGGGYGLGVVESPTKEDLLKIYPTPTSILITIETSTIPTPCQLSVIDINGQVILQQEITEPSTTIDVSGLESGVYTVKVFGKKGVQVGKFIKQ